MAAASKAPLLKYPLTSSPKMKTSYQDDFRVRHRRREDIVNPKQHRYYAIRNFFTSKDIGPKWFDCIEKEFVYCPRREYERKKAILTTVEQSNEIERQKPNHPDYKPPCEKPIWEQYHVKKSHCHQPKIRCLDRSASMACRFNDPYTPHIGCYAPRYRQYQKLPQIEEEAEVKDQS